MSTSPTPNPMDVDSVHLLQDLARFYDSGTEMVVSEAFGNAVDVDATELQIELDQDKDGKYIQFVNNGPPMSEQDFRNYHVIARSSKTYGKGLGWAGIGAKLYLGSWLESKIVTESSDGTKSLASVMFIQNNQASWNFVEPTRKFVGTSYKVYLKPEDYEILTKTITQTVLKYFNTSMRNGLSVIIQGKKLEPWRPTAVKTFKREITIKDRKLPFTLWITEESIPDNRCNIEYHVSGKSITITKPKNLLSNVRSEFKKKFYAIVDALCISDQLGSNKHNFRLGIFTRNIEPEIEREINKILKELGYLEDPDEAKTLKNKFTNALQKILKDNFPELNPKSICGNMNRNGESLGKGTRVMKSEEQISKDDKKEKKDENKDEKKDRKKSRNRGGFSFTTVVKPDDQRQGWMQIESNQIVVNLGHPVARNVEKTKEGKQYHLCRIISSQLLKLASKAGKMTVDKALDIEDKIFTLLEKEFHSKRRDVWNFNIEGNPRRDANGKFLP